MKCNGCGGEFDPLGGVLSYGNVSMFNGGANRDGVRGDYRKTLCPRCQHVLLDILKSSDLSDHWHKYEWAYQSDACTEAYND
jgi:hypothetical protein